MTISFGWGPVEARALARAAACVVVVDVLSFTTSVGVAVEAGAAVHPYRWRDATAAAYADRVGATLAVGRGEATPDHPWTLSPAALRAAPMPPRLVLPSPNGSTIAAEAEGYGATVVAASLRNRTAVARWLADRGYGSADRPLAVIASGERWPDGSLRPALEDLLGAGAVLSALAGTGTPTPEASAAATLWTATEDPVAALHGCDSGRELYEYGFPQDVAVAAETDSSTTVPVLVDGAFQEASAP
ncbi:Putative lipoprotein [Streptomyces venezuelae]|uniref:2-phosphosulfolactate phosphatase n=1 Tax=Streptomyces gardneri TaxID=66892 RepID=UPI0006BD7BAC|nr:2-phosphosulfolactate phosphatase [Streptomyces gardneri]ALO12090.1 Putative lipoprotein [Streptomyces venezuelae]QPK48924.1 2-phosphosulfolactate phosphatase [Streptomyces gardneri]WRK40412.1 2-phosphosulfolactate phosphatase [Streptomyces venezuelae]CUM37337.1 putative lipoprotein [Streptomyces venezuelae]